MRSISRVVDVSLNTVTKLLIDAGKVCAAYHDEHVRGVKATRVQCDEIWAFCYSKQRDVAAAKAAPEGACDAWTWTAIDGPTKLLISYMVGGRDSEYAMGLMDDLRSRLANRVQLTGARPPSARRVRGPRPGHRDGITGQARDRRSRHRSDGEAITPRLAGVLQLLNGVRVDGEPETVGFRARAEIAECPKRSWFSDIPGTEARFPRTGGQCDGGDLASPLNRSCDH